MNPELINIFGLSIRWYSILILIGALLGYLIAKKESKKMELPPNFVDDFAFWLIIIGIIGARLYYVMFNFKYYIENPFEILAVWHGGLAIHGGIIAGLIFTIIYCKKKNISILKVTDIVAPSLIIAQAIGRWGNFFNSEAHGPATTYTSLKNLIIIPNFVINGMKIDGIYYHPTFFYESMWCLIGFIILLIVKKIKKNNSLGILTFIYLIWYSIGRIIIESLRTDSLMLGSIKIAQLISFLAIIIGLIGIIKIIFDSKKTIKNKK